VEKKSEQAAMKTWLIVLIVLLDDVAALALVFLVLWFFNVKITLVTMIVTILVAGSLILIVHRAVVPNLRRRTVTGSEGMIGMVGEVVESHASNLIIRVNGEYWQAECPDGDVATGEEVEVVGINRLKLEVKRRAS
jgi:membrane-bound ClpP family serine protease